MLRAFLLATAAVVCLPVCPALAQEAEDDTATMGKIVVTAQRREENLQDVPLAVSAFDGDDLQKRGAGDVRDLVSLTPGATFTFINAAEPVIAIRGIASGGEGAASDSGVLMMVDGEVISRDFMRAAPIFDVERVEVLRGPQGTTYGRNATGGVFHVINKRPGREFGGDISVEIGDYSLLTTNAAVDVPLAESTAARIAFYQQTRDGYSKDYFSGRDVDYRRAWGGRLSVSHDVNESLSLLFRGRYSSERLGETGPLKAYDPTLPFLTGQPYAPTFTEPQTDQYRIGTTPGSYFDRDVWGASLEAVWDGAVNITSLTGFQRGENDYVTGSPFLQGAPAGLAPRGYNMVDGDNEADIFSQEVRISDEIYDGAILWTLGGFYLHEDVFFGYDRLAGFGIDQRLRQHSVTDGFGLFGEVVGQINDKLTLTVGLRESKDDKDYSVDNRATGPAAGFFIDDPSTPVIATASDSWSKTTGRASLAYKWTDDISTYLTYSQGYKAGGFNAEPANLEAATTPFDEEVIENIEAGLRSAFFDDALSLNITVFDMTYDDIQSAFFVPNGTEIIANVGEASIRGIETEFVLRPSQYVHLSGSYAALDHEYTEYVDDDGNDLSGFKIAKVPDWTFTLSGLVSTPSLGGAGHAEFKIDYRTRSDVFHDVPPDPTFGIRPSTDQLDLRLNWIPEHDGYELSVWVRNALDEAEMQYIGPRTPSLQQRPVIYGPPRTMGVTLSTKF